MDVMFLEIAHGLPSISGGTMDFSATSFDCGQKSKFCEPRVLA